MNIKIEKNVPMPVRVREGHPISTALLNMEIGDSFYIEEKYHIVASRRQFVQSKTGKHFIMAKEGSGLRIWRDE